MKQMSAIFALVITLTACATVEQSKEPINSPVNIVLDEKLLVTAERIRGFGGMYFDDDGNLNVYLVEDVPRLSAESVKSKQAQIKSILEEVFGKENLSRRAVTLRQKEKRSLSEQPLKIILVKGDYDIVQLTDWRGRIDRALEVPGVVFTDIDERSNRLKIGIESKVSREGLDELLKKAGVPREAVVIEETKPIRFHASLRDNHRPMPAGVQVAGDVGRFSYNICTTGFNAIRSNISGFVTCSHCTKTQGGSEGTDFHQPDESWWSEFTGGSDKKVGDEIADPSYFTGGASCPSGRRCRYSDSAFIDYTVSRGQDIARTTGWNNGSLTINSSNSRLRITGETSTWVNGSELDKIGRTTGWTYGRVNGTCQNINVADTNITLLCQYRVARIPGHTQTMSDHGDSGSPVFVYQGTTVLLAGILWGGDDGSQFVFSPMNQVEQELGALTTFDFPTPHPPYKPCANTQKCCGVVRPDGTCDGQCWPKNKPCP